jgi:hypothetical protein
MSKSLASRKAFCRRCFSNGHMYKQCPMDRLCKHLPLSKKQLLIGHSMRDPRWVPNEDIDRVFAGMKCNTEKWIGRTSRKTESKEKAAQKPYSKRQASMICVEL